MRRRDFITLLGGAAAAWPLAARAQQPDRLPRVVYLAGTSEDDPESLARVAAFRAAFAKLGWADGRNVGLDYRWGAISPGSERAIAAELVRSAPAVILCTGTPMSSALRQETSTIPVVFAAASDPVGSGLVDGMAR